MIFKFVYTWQGGSVLNKKIENLTSSQKTFFILLISKTLGFIREGIFFFISLSSPQGVNAYFISSQIGILLAEKKYKYYLILIISTLLITQKLNYLIILFSIALPFYFWPSILRSINIKKGVTGVVLLTIIFNLLSIFELIVKSKIPSLEYNTPVLSLWLIIILSYFIFNLVPPEPIPPILVKLILILLSIRILNLLDLISVEEQSFFYIIQRAAEIMLPQIANYIRIFKEK